MEHMKRPCFRGRASWFSSFVACLAGDYIGRTRAFFALSDLELDLLTFVERCIAGCLNFRVVDEQIFAAIVGINEAIALT
jgi:hypothetical protein